MFGGWCHYVELETWGSTMNGGVYSVVVEATRPAFIKSQRCILDRGRNVFSVVVSDHNAFVKELDREGVSVVAMHLLGETTADPLPLLPV